MKILIITQVFYPDTVSLSQHLSDLAFKLSDDGHEVVVYSSCFPYEEKNHRYSRKEYYLGVKIIRLWQSAFGKASVFNRILDFSTFYFSIFFKLLFVKNKEYDVILGTTSPPFLSFIGVVISKLKNVPFHYWVMDLQPELSISHGLMKENSIIARLFTKIGNYTIKSSSSIISLDRFMTDYLHSRGALRRQINTIPVWPVMDSSHIGERMSNPFRQLHGFGDRFVIMYSGNHALVHPLETLLQAALLLQGNSKYLFVFIGGGVRKKDVTNFKTVNNLTNIIQLPFQPRENIHNSLGSADLQVVILGNGQVGYTHPNKIYGAMYIGKPILYIGPKESHVTDILTDLDGNISVSHGEYEDLVIKIEQLFNNSNDVINKIGEENKKYAIEHFHPEILKQKMIEAIIV